MENKTVLQQLSEWVEKEKKISLNLRDGGGLVAFELMSKKIKEIESNECEQILTAFVAGSNRGTGEIPFNAEQYYTQTYKGK